MVSVVLAKLLNPSQVFGFFISLWSWEMEVLSCVKYVHQSYMKHGESQRLLVETSSEDINERIPFQMECFLRSRCSHLHAHFINTYMHTHTQLHLHTLMGTPHVLPSYQ